MKLKRPDRKTYFLATVLILLIGATLVNAMTEKSTGFFSPYSKAFEAPSEQKSLAAFDTILQVLRSPRCMNCHPNDDFPRQGDEQKIHLFNVERGPDNKGTEVQKCATCHNTENNSYTNIPGAPNWHLAPKSMGWIGLSDHEIGASILDPEKNGGKTVEEIVHHMGHDSLVLWAWNPGEGRTPPPIGLDDFRIALDNWLHNGAHIPAEKE